MNRTEADGRFTPREILGIVEESQTKEFMSFGLSHFVKELFPEIKETPIPDCVALMVSQIESVTKPLFENSPDMLITNAYALVRGSTIKRKLWGTPSGFWDVSRLFKQLNESENLIGNDPVAQKIVEKLAFGPRDLDVRYCYQDGKGPNEMHDAIEKSLVDSGFTKNEKEDGFSLGDNQHTFSVSVKTDDIGGESSPPRTYFNVVFSLNDGEIFRVDFGDLPITCGQLWDDRRFHDSYPAIEACLVGLLTKKPNNSVLLKIDKNQRKWLKDWRKYVVKITYETKYLAYVHANLRAINPLLFWFPEFVAKKNGFASLGALLNRVKHFLHSDWEDAMVFRKNAKSEQADMIRKKIPVMAEFMTYLTYDPFIFLMLLDRMPSFRTIPLGKIIVGIKSLQNVLYMMGTELDEKIDAGLCTSYRDNVLPSLSNQYRNKMVSMSSITESGPFMLLRALKKADLIPRETPETMEEIVKLFDVS